MQLLIWVLLVLALASCQLRRVVISPQLSGIQRDTLGYWKHCRSYRLANGATCVDLIDSSHHRCRYTLIFQRYRWVRQAARPAAAELALHWLLAEPTATHQAPLMKEIQLSGGRLDVIGDAEYIGIQLVIDSIHALRAIERLITHLAAPRWTSELYFQTRDEMAARRVNLESSINYKRQIGIDAHFWPDGTHPGASHGSYAELMGLRPEDAKSAFRSLWFSCPKAHVLSMPHAPNFDALYSILERIPHWPLSDCPVPTATSLDSVWSVQMDTLSQPQLWGVAQLSGIDWRPSDSISAILPLFWTHVLESELKNDLCRKRSLTCQLRLEAHSGPRPYLKLYATIPVPNTSLDRIVTIFRDLEHTSGLSPDRWTNLIEHFRFNWLLERSSPANRHSALVAAVGNESIETELAVPLLLHQLTQLDFISFHRRAIRQFRWLYVGQPTGLKDEPVVRFRSLGRN